MSFITLSYVLKVFVLATPVPI